MPIDLTKLSDSLKELEKIEESFIAAIASAHFDQVLSNLSHVPEDQWNHKKGGTHTVFLNTNIDYVFRGAHGGAEGSSSRSPSFYAEKKKKRTLGSVVSSPIMVDSAYSSGDLSIMLKANQGDLDSQLSLLVDLPIDEFVILFGQILTLICRYHAQNYSHNDIKPLNILVHQSSSSAPRQFRLSDFEAKTERQRSLGSWIEKPIYTANYLSPYARCLADCFFREEEASLDINLTQDITKFLDPYATGITLLEIFTQYEPSLAALFEAYKKNKATILDKALVPNIYTASQKLQELLQLDTSTLDMIDARLRLDMDRMENEHILNELIKQIYREFLLQSDDLILSGIQQLLKQPGLLTLDASITTAIEKNRQQHGLVILNEETFAEITRQINDGRIVTLDSGILAQVREQMVENKLVTLDVDIVENLRGQLHEKESAKRKLFNIIVQIISACNNMDRRDDRPLDEALQTYYAQFPKVSLPTFDSKIIVDDVDSSILDSLQKIKSHLTNAVDKKFILSSYEIQLFQTQIEGVRTFLSPGTPKFQGLKEQLLEVDSQKSLLKRIEKFFNPLAKMVEPILLENKVANDLVEELQNPQSTLHDRLGADHLLVQLKDQNPAIEFNFIYVGNNHILVEFSHPFILLNQIKMILDVATKKMWLNMQGEWMEDFDLHTVVALIYTRWKQDPRAYTPLGRNTLRAIQKRFPTVIFTRHLEMLTCFVRLTLIDQEQLSPPLVLSISQLCLGFNLRSDTLQMYDPATHQPLSMIEEKKINSHTVKRQLLTQVYQAMHDYPSSVFLQVAQTHALCYVEIVTQREFEAREEKSNTYFLIYNDGIAHSLFDQWRLCYTSSIKSGVQQIFIPLEKGGRTPITHYQLLSKSIMQLTEEDRKMLKKDIEAFHENVLENLLEANASKLLIYEYLENYYRALNASLPSPQRCL